MVEDVLSVGIVEVGGERVASMRVCTASLMMVWRTASRVNAVDVVIAAALFSSSADDAAFDLVVLSDIAN